MHSNQMMEGITEFPMVAELHQPIILGGVCTLHVLKHTSHQIHHQVTWMYSSK